jgi:hypothetical protein
MLALLLGLRLLSPAGFMPAFAGGGVSIVACPDDAPGAAAAMADHDHRHGKAHQQCPYAAASALGALGHGQALTAPSLLFPATLLLGRTFLFLERSRSRERPPLRGPPVPA